MLIFENMCKVKPLTVFSVVIFQGLYQKAEALYYMGEFEFALMFYHRGQKLRPQVQEFRLGIQKAQEAIENSVGCMYFGNFL